MPILVATDRDVVVIDVERGTSTPAHGIINRPTCLAADPLVQGRACCGTHYADWRIMPRSPTRTREGAGCTGFYAA